MCSRRARMSLGCHLQWQLSVSGSWPFRRPRKTASLRAKHGRLIFNFMGATSPRAPNGPDEDLDRCMGSRRMRLSPVAPIYCQQRRQMTTGRSGKLPQRSGSLIRRSTRDDSFSVRDRRETYKPSRSVRPSITPRWPEGFQRPQIPSVRRPERRTGTPV
jgi:hypothetical protein